MFKISKTLKIFSVLFLLLLSFLITDSKANAQSCDDSWTDSARGCKTDCMKDGLFCFWDEGKSWADNNTNDCVVESTTDCPTNPSNGSYAFSCNTNDCVLSCNSGYTKCGTSCVLNDPLPPNCTSYNQCTDTCTSCTAGYTVVGGVCEGVSLKLANDSVASGGNIIQSTNPVFYINPTGNIGISTSTPQSKLHVIGGVKMSNLDGSYRVPIADTELVPRYYVDENFAPITGGTGTAFLQGGNSFGSTATLGTNDAYNLDFITSSSTRMTIDASGNVGIGTTSPGAKLEIAESKVILKLQEVGTSNRYATLGFSDGYNFVFDASTGAVRFANSLQPTIDSLRSLGDPILRWEGVYAVNGILTNVYASEKVGIATTTPQAKLHVIGDAKMSNLDGSYRVPVADTELVPKYYVDENFVPSVGGAGSGFIQGGNSFTATAVLGTKDAYNLDFITSSTTRMTIDASGNVGIGTTLPEGLVHGYSNSGSDASMIFEATSANAPFVAKVNTDIKTGSFFIYDGATRIGGLVNERTAGDVLGGVRNDLGLINYVNDKDIFLKTNNGNVLIPEGNVGIGTVSSNYKLDINTSANDAFKITDSLGSIIINGAGFNVDRSTAYFSSTGAMRFQTAGLDKIILSQNGDFDLNSGQLYVQQSSGNVGIATTTPQSKLHVIGAAKMSNLDGSYRVPVADTELVPKYYVDENFASIIGGGSAVFVGLTTSTYNGNQGGYESVNTLCSTEYADSHVCSTQEIYNTINLGLMSSFPAGPVSFWLNSGPPGYTANVNDCAGWKSSTADDYGAVWVISGTIFSSGIDKCLETRSFACCASS